ncbi:MAG: NAD(P)-dependent oxidoreductase [Burkholderiales bacterium]|nr:NAD(P)-dependent oxidoreductase [Burkholderiales bacterium]
MLKKTIAILHPGEMGAAIGAGLVSKGHRVLWVSEGRGAATRRRAESSGLEDIKTLARAAQESDIVFSVCPPHAAMELAQAVAACGFGGVYVDANAVSTETTRALGRVVEAAGASYVDAGIIGPPPVAGASVRLYVCGSRAIEVAALFEGCIMQAHALEGPVGAASALKVCYAAWNKGATALLAGIRALAEHEGVDAALLDEWKISLPDIPKRSELVRKNARKAWRWIAEMEEIAANFEAAGLPAGFHLAAADIYRKLAGFKDAAEPPPLAEIKAALLRRP